MASTIKFFACFHIAFGSILKLRVLLKPILLILIIMLTASGITYSQTLIQGVEEQDYQALVDLYNSTGGASWTNRAGWLEDNVLVSEWFGITVANNRVTSIYLQSNRLQGSLPLSLGNLTALTSLRLGYNGNLGGEIPSSIGNLVNLQNLQLHGNSLTGELPAGMSKFTKLGYLYLNNNFLSGSIEPVGNLKLIQLRLQNNQFSGPIPEGIGNMTSLQHLYLENNQFSGPIPESLGGLINVSNIMLGNNQLTGEIPASLGGLPKLKSLHLYSNNLSGPIPEELGNVSTLKSFAVSGNQLSGSVPESMAGLPVLEVFDVSNNQITGLPSTPFVSTAMVEFDVSSNQLTFEDMEPHQGQTEGNFISTQPVSADTTVYIAEGGAYTIEGADKASSTYYKWYKDGVVVQEGNLNSYTISNFTVAEQGSYSYELTNSGFPDVVQKSGRFELKANVLVQGVYVQDYDALVELYNSTGGANWTNKTNWLNSATQVSQWSGVVMANNRVTKLTLPNNNLKGQIPESIGNLSQLQVLHLNNNPLGGTIPERITQLVNLTDLRLQVAELTGSIPSEIGDLTKVQHLWLYQNSLSGSIPPSIGKMRGLLTIGLNNNKNLTGQIPESLGNLTQLRQLFLWGNKLEGPIPESLGNLVALQILEMHGNSLTGTIPESFGNLINLQKLSLWGNAELGGIIPDNLRNLKNLEYFWVGYWNSFEGPIPPWLGELPKLKELYLAFCKLSGTIPSELRNLSNLQNLVIRGNDISGDFPEWIVRDLPELKILAIGESRIGGAIPDSIGRLTKLTELWIQRSNIAGKIPESLLKCTSLSIIEMNHTKLEELPDFINQFPKLTRLIANNNTFTNLPDFSNHPNKANLEIFADSNHFSFSVLEKNFTAAGTHPFKLFTYTSQTPKVSVKEMLAGAGQKVALNSQDNAPHNLYQWQKQLNGAWTDIAGATAATYEAALTEGEANATYRCRITNEWVTDLTLYSPVYNLTEYVNENENVVFGSIPGNLTSEYCAIGKFYTPTSGVTSGDQYPSEGGAGISGIEIDETNNIVYAGAGPSYVWALDRNTNTGSIIGKDKPVSGTPFPGHTLSMYLDEKEQQLYVGTWGQGIWIYDINQNTGKRITTGFIPENGGDAMPGDVINDFHRERNKLYISIFQTSWRQGGVYIWDLENKTGKLLNAANTSSGGKYAVQGDPMPGDECRTSAYHVRNGKEYIYVGIEEFGLWEFNVTDNIGRLLTPENTKPGGAQEVVGDPMVDHEMYNIHFVGDKLITGFWRGQAVWIYDVSTNESTVLSHETTKPGGKHAVEGDPYPGVEISNGEYFGGGIDIDYSKGTIYRAFGRTMEGVELFSSGGIWEYELKTNKARFYGHVDEGEDFVNGARFVIKKDELNNKVYSTSWPVQQQGGLFELSFSTTPCAPENPSDDKDLNWEYVKTFDANGDVIGEAKQFLDKFGRPTQSQSKSFSQKHVFASQQLYDQLGKPVLSTLPAPVNNRAFNYKEGFVKNASDTDYSPADFDGEKLSSPNPVGNAEEGTLGWYYSANNTYEPQTATTQYPYARSWTEQTADPKVAKSAGPGDQYRMGSGHEVEGERQDIAAGELDHYWSLRQHFYAEDQTSMHKNGYKYISTGPEGHQSVSFTDAGGKTLASALIINGSYDYWNYVYYNDLGQVLASVAPEGVNPGSAARPTFVTEFEYDHLGRTIAASSTDEGTSDYVYSYDGKVRFSQNQEQRNSSPARFSYTNYDYQGRLIESGEYVMSGSGFYIFETHKTATSNAKSIFTIVDKVGAAGALDADRCQDVNKISYDFQTADFPANALHPAQQFMYGQVSKTENENVKRWYSYDEQGRLVWMIQEIEGLGTKTVDYSYDFIGNVLEVAYQKGQPDAFYHHYSYDSDQRLAAVYTSLDGQNRKIQAKYEYYLHGPLKREVIGNNLQGIDYTYTISGALKAINHFDVEKDPGRDGENGVAPDVFGMSLEYHEQDYDGAGYEAGAFSASGYSNHFNGLPKAQNWRSPIDGKPRSYAYEYDETNQLAKADWGDVSGSNGAYGFAKSATSQHQVQISDYDKHGNIKGLNRKGDTGNTLADYSYEYIPNTNRLAKVSHQGNELLSYEYNAIGQLIRQTEGSESMYMEYDAYGMVTAVFADEAKGKPVVLFTYDDKGLRLSKTSYNESGQPVWKTWYVYDAGGNLMSLYEENIQQNIPALQIELPIYGGARIGQYKPLEETYLYEIKDHTGSVRAVIGDTEPKTFLATMEREQADEEEWNFVDFAARANQDGKDTRVVVPEFLNHTPLAETGEVPEAVRLNAAENVMQGPRKTLRVFPGDVVEANVWAKYLRLNEGSEINANAVIGALAGAGGYTVSTDATGLTTVSDNVGNMASFGGAAAGETGAPNASISYQLYDIGYNLLDQGFIKLSTEAAVDAEALDKAHEQLILQALHIEQAGYLNIELRHDLKDGQPEQAEIYFDDFEVTHTPSKVVVAYDYYPFGMPMENRQLEREKTRHNYQGEYAQKDDETGYLAFQLRFYDARIGRWVSPDPYGQFASPYVGMGNIGHFSSDPDGGWSWVTAGVGTVVGAGIGYAVTGDWQGAVAGGLAGGLIGGASFTSGTTQTGYNPSWSGTASFENTLAFNPSGFTASTNAAAGLLRGYVQEDGGPSIRIQVWDKPAGWDKDEYTRGLRHKLITNGFSENLQITYSDWVHFKAFLGGRPTATITIKKGNITQDFYDAGGYAVPKSHQGTIYTGLILGPGHDQVLPMWKYVNATVHELGHAIFGSRDYDTRGTGRPSLGLMDYAEVYNSPDVNFTRGQQKQIRGSKWGK